MTQKGIIGGSGLYSLPAVELIKEITVNTPYGSPSDSYKLLKIGGEEVFFLPRHGHGHKVPPHKVNYRANIRGFKELGVTRLLATGTVGSMNKKMAPGTLVIIDQVMDMTKSRVSTFYDQDEVYHIDFTEPYCPELRGAFMAAAKDLQMEEVVSGGVYACTEGPRLESPAEIRFLASAGADLVGMTGMPETALARELEICYASVAIVVNYAAGMAAGGPLAAREIIAAAATLTAKVNSLLSSTLGHIPQGRGCSCKDALKGARL